MGFYNVNVFETHVKAGTTVSQPAPTNGSDFYVRQDSDRFVYLSKSVGGTGKIKLWFLFEVDDDTVTQFGLSESNLMVGQPFEIDIDNSNWAARSLTNTGAKGVYFEVTNGTVDVLISSNNLDMM